MHAILLTRPWGVDATSITHEVTEDLEAHSNWATQELLLDLVKG
jgi:hypothetical protein